MALYRLDWTEQLAREQEVLAKAKDDVEKGWDRLRDQQDLLSKLEISGRDTQDAERLVHLMKGTLLEWERHRRLAEQRVDYLKNEVFRLHNA